MRAQLLARRRGNILVLAAILMVVMFALVAFAIDIGRITLARTELQTAADAAALAGAQALPDGPAQAKLVAQNSAEENDVVGSPVAIVAGEDIELGRWDSDTRTFTLLTGADESDADSVRVTCRCVASRANSVPLFFAPILGTQSADAVATAIARRKASCGGFIGIDSADLNGNQAYTDSYNADVGPYASQTPGDKGHICSNGPIDIQNGNVNGNAMPGPGYSVTINQGSVSGSTSPRTNSLILPPVDFGNVATFNDNDSLPAPPYVPASTEFKHNGGDFYLPSGTYYFTDLLITGGPVRVDGPVIIYVQGNINMSGYAIVNETQISANLKIFAEGSTVKVAGSADFFGFVYAPSSDVETAGGASFFGAAVGKTLKLHNDGGVHADEALSRLGEFPSRHVLVD